MTGRRNWPVIGGTTLLVVAALVLGVFGIAYFLDTSGALDDVAVECADGGQPALGDGGDTLTVTSSGGTEGAERATTVSVCVLNALDAPASVRSKIEGTTAMMGRQTDSWGDYELTWTYHPNNGLEIIVETD
jgi:hypothetical protein